MTRTGRWFVASLAALTFALSVPAFANDPAAGRQLYGQVGCQQCHGVGGNGGRGPALARKKLPQSKFFSNVRFPHGGMPAYPPAFLNDHDLGEIYAYLTSAPSASVPGPAPSAPSGSAALGHQLFVKDGCYECHGYVGQGSSRTGPALTPHPIPYLPFAAQVRIPRGYMPKYPERFLSNQDLADIYAYVSSIPPPPPVSSLPILTDR